MRNLLSFLNRFSLLSAVILVCSFSPAIVIGQTTEVEIPAAPNGNLSIPAASSSDYVLRPSDVLQVKVFKEEDMTREISVSTEMSISLPLIGNIDVKNRTVRQLEEIIRQLYDRDFLVNPQVTVIVLRYAERAVNVIGMVNTPQAVPFPPERGLTLLEAIARAGGFNRLADRANVKITRTDEKGISNTFTVNAEKLLDSKSANLWSLQVDDVVFVPEKFF
jgi:polysaccharide export outer membrane protein